MKKVSNEDLMKELKQFEKIVKGKDKTYNMTKIIIAICGCLYTIIIVAMCVL